MLAQPTPPSSVRMSPVPAGTAKTRKRELIRITCTAFEKTKSVVTTFIAWTTSKVPAPHRSTNLRANSCT